MLIQHTSESSGSTPPTLAPPPPPEPQHAPSPAPVLTARCWRPASLSLLLAFKWPNSSPSRAPARSRPDPKPQAPYPQTPNPKPQAPKPQTSDPEPQAPAPEPCAGVPCAAEHAAGVRHRGGGPSHPPGGPAAAAPAPVAGGRRAGDPHPVAPQLPRGSRAQPPAGGPPGPGGLPGRYPTPWPQTLNPLLGDLRDLVAGLASTLCACHRLHTGQGRSTQPAWHPGWCTGGLPVVRLRLVTKGRPGWQASGEQMLQVGGSIRVGLALAPTSWPSDCSSLSPTARLKGVLQTHAGLPQHISGQTQPAKSPLSGPSEAAFSGLLMDADSIIWWGT